MVLKIYRLRLEDHDWFVYIVPCFMAIISFVNGLSGQLVHDDIFAIKNNPDVTGHNPLYRLFQNDFWGMPMLDINSHKSYRPLCVLSFRLDYIISGGSCVWFHLVNTGLHVCVTVLLTVVCLRVLHASRQCALLSSSLFAVHPIHTEAVTGLVGRADVLAALCFLLSFYTYSRCVLGSADVTRDSSHKKQSDQTVMEVLPARMFPAVVSLLLAAAAMLCKETGIMVIGVSLLFDLLIHGRHILEAVRQRSLSTAVTCCLLRCFSLLIVAASLMFFRLWIMDFKQPQVFQEESNPASFSPFLLTRVLTFLFLPALNLWLLLCPSTLSYDWTGGSVQLLTSLADPRNVYSLMFYTLAVTLVLRCVRAAWSKPCVGVSASSLVPVMSAGLMVLPFLPASNLFFRVGFVVAERVLYIPSMGYSVLVACGFLSLCSRLPKMRGLLLILYCLLLVVLMVRTWNRNPVWQSRHSLFWSGVRTLPHNAKIHYNLANLLKDEGNMSGAEEHYRMAIQLNPRVASYHLNLGTVLTNKTLARLSYLEALRLRPQHAGALVNLGNLLIDGGDLSGVAHIKQALDIDPNHIEALLAMSSVLMKSGDFREAERYISHALQIKPDSAKVHLCHAMYLHSTDQSSAALQEYQATLRLDPSEINALLNSARIHFTRGQLMEAEKQLKKAVAVSAGCSECLSLLGSVYSRLGRTHEAVITMGQASAVASNNTTINLKYINMLKETQQRDKARSVLLELLTRVPRSSIVLRFAFGFAMEDERYAEALHYIQEAISVTEETGDGTLSEMYRDLGEAYRLNGDSMNALKYYQQAVQLNPTYVEAITDVGTVHFLQRNFAQAESYYLRALSIEPNHNLTRQNLAKLRHVYTKTGTDKTR